MSHDHDDHGHDAHGHGDADATPPVKGKQYWETTPARRARPQFDCVEIARSYLDEMEKGGRLHNKRKRA